MSQHYTHRIESYPTKPVVGYDWFHLTMCFTRRLSNSKNFVRSACLAEVGALLSVILAVRIVYSAFGINK